MTQLIIALFLIALPTFSFFFIAFDVFRIGSESSTDSDHDQFSPKRRLKQHLLLNMKKRHTENSENLFEHSKSDIRLLQSFSKSSRESFPQRDLQSVTDNTYDVIIIGAGMAGISAAMTLEAQGISNYIILEAKDHIGGRTYTEDEELEGDKIPVDAGAMWIHGGSSNPLNDIAKEVNIQTSLSTYNQRVYDANGGGAISNTILNQVYNQNFENGFMRYQASQQESTDIDEPLERSANTYASSVSDSLKKRVLQHLYSSLIELDYSGTLSKLSLWWWDSDWILGDDDFLVTGGFGNLVQKYALPILSKVETETIVTKVNYKFDIIRVITNKGRFKGKRVICSAPLGVLKARSINFRPKLPKKHRVAIKRLGMGTMNKIFLFWKSSDVFWPQNIEMLGDATDRDTNFSFFNFMSYNGNKPYLAALFHGSQAEQLETLYSISDPERYKQEIRDLAMTSLRNMFGSNIPMPEKVIVTNWNADDFTRGSYSYNKVNMKPKHRKNLASPIKQGKLIFAGEATDHRYFQTVHGAYFSGKDAANKVIGSLS